MKDKRKAHIESVVIGEIGKDLGANMLTGKFNPEKTADKCLDALKSIGITPMTLCSEFSLDDMLKVAKAKGLPDAIKPYLERFYAHVRGQAVANTQTEAPVGPRDATQGGKPGDS